MIVLELFDMCPGDIRCVSLRCLMGVLEIFVGVLKIFDRCPGYI